MNKPEWIDGLPFYTPEFDYGKEKEMIELTTYYKPDRTVACRGFTKHGCGTDTFYREISKDEYDRLIAMSYVEVDKEIRDTLSDSVKYGYGYYGHELIEKDGMYFLGETTGDSCD